MTIMYDLVNSYHLFACFLWCFDELQVFETGSPALSHFMCFWLLVCNYF